MELLPESQMANILMWVLALNAALAGASKVLEIIKDKTATQVDNKIAGAISKIADLLGKAIDILGMNRPHK